MFFNINICYTITIFISFTKQSNDLIGYYNPQGYPEYIDRDQISYTKDLDRLENSILDTNLFNFIQNKYSKSEQIKDSLNKNNKEISKIHKALSNKMNTPKITNDLLVWLKLKNDEGKLLNEQLQLFQDISLAITKIEVAKYAHNSQILDSFLTLLPYHTEPEQTNNFNSYENNVRNIIKSPDKIDKNETKEKSSNEKITIEKKSMIEKALSSIDYIQKITSLDAMNIIKLISTVKNLIIDEIGERELYLKNLRNLQNLDTELDKRNIIARHNIDQYNEKIKQAQISLDESRNRLWTVKQIEWVITQVEALKYVSLLKKDSNDNQKYNSLIRQLMIN